LRLRLRRRDEPCVAFDGSALAGAPEDLWNSQQRPAQFGDFMELKPKAQERLIDL
jgi:hypothetical protein